MYLFIYLCIYLFIYFAGWMLLFSENQNLECIVFVFIQGKNFKKFKWQIFLS